MPDHDPDLGALPAQIILLARAWRQLADRVLASLEISNSKGYALLHLERLGQGTRQSDLAKAIGISEASLVRTLQQLERAEYVRRETDPGDGRAKSLYLTDEGSRLARLIDDRLIELRKDLLAGIDDADLNTTNKVLATIAARIADSRLN